MLRQTAMGIFSRKGAKKWMELINACGDQVDKVVAVIERLARTGQFQPEAMEYGFRQINSLNPSFAAIESACRKTSNWYTMHGPDAEYGFIDEAFSVEHSNRCYKRWEELSLRLLEQASDFYSALEVARHAHPRVSHTAQHKAVNLASEEEHLLDLLDFNRQRRLGPSVHEQQRYIELATTTNIRREVLRERDAHRDWWSVKIPDGWL